MGAMTLDVPFLGAHYYASNLHKWACTAKGSAFLWVAPSEQRLLLPLVTSHGYGLVRSALLRSRAAAAKGARDVLACTPLWPSQEASLVTELSLALTRAAFASVHTVGFEIICRMSSGVQG